MTDVSVEEQLGSVRGMLEADGYELEVDETSSNIHLRILAGPTACEDCLIPKALMADIIRGKITNVEKEIVLEYPADG